MSRLSYWFILLLVLTCCYVQRVAATVVRLDLNFGNQPGGAVYMTLFDVDAPITVANFLNYIDDGKGGRRYDGTFIHRSAPDFVIQGGGYAYDSTLGAFGPDSAPHISTDASIQNEFDPTRSNVRGTVAMAKLGGDPDSATSEWFVNLRDNSANLDSQNGGFTVFGRVLGDGMTLIDSVSALGVVNEGGAFVSLPVIDVTATVNEANLITLRRAVIDPPAAVYPDSVELDFGLVAINGDPVTRTLTIQNIGGQDLLVGGVGGGDGLVTPFSFSSGGDNCSGRSLAPTATCAVDIALASNAVGDLQDSFDVPSNDSDRPGLVITVRGRGVPETPVLEVQPLALDFGTVGTGQPRELNVTLTNHGGGQLFPLELSISNDSANAFSIPGSANGCSGAQLAIGQSCAFLVKLFVFSVGEQTATVNVLADPGNQMAQVSLKANVALLEPAIELPEQIVVPDVRFRESRTASLRISNTGVDDLFLSAVDVLGTDAALFSVATANCIDIPIAPRSSACSEVINFNPTAAGEFRAVLRVRSNDPTQPSIDVPIVATASQDADGVSDRVEQAAPNEGDANRDGIPDASQENVTSLLDKAGNYVTIETSVGVLRDVRLVEGASLGAVPTINEGTLEFANGFFAFIVDNVPSGSGGSAVVKLYLPKGRSASDYFKFGRLPGESPFLVPEHWYLFAFDATTGTGAEISANQVTLHLTDGGRGDNDQVANGRIVDPGGPVVLRLDGGVSSGGGCATLGKRTLSDVNRIGLDFPVLLAALLLLRLSFLTFLRQRRRSR